PLVGARLRRERIVPAVVVANTGAERLVAAGAADALDPGVLVERHGLRRQLSADPVGLLGHDDAETRARRGKRRCAATEPAADDDDVGRKLARRTLSRRATGPG